MALMGAMPVMCVANTDVKSALVHGHASKHKNLNDENQICACAKNEWVLYICKVKKRN